MGAVLKQLVKFSSTTSATTGTFTTTADILVGEDIFIVAGRANSGATVCGILNISTNAGAGTFERVATSCRANTFDVTLGRFRVTTLIPAGSIITATYRAASAKRGSIMQVVSGLTSAAAHRSSGNAADNQLGNTNMGDNGSSTSAATSTISATTIPDCLIIGGFGEGGTNVFAGASGTTKVDESRTTSGTADRGVGLFYKIASVAAIQTLNASVSPSGSWAGVVGAFEIASPPPPSSPTFQEWDGAAWQDLVAMESDGADNWSELTPAEL